ncbi:hypothetical protein [Haloimpatiens lingqiaonensis]|uniref:hypothetical protein n=1 Tax=Haloimpatiens lingqiaonensis TaxID=1380675 RepID=UPI0010FE07AD|nr:hypothetical protein [Haloimpatiens lingqiaonensis]
MKRFKKLLLWVIIGLLLQTLLLWYLDKYILGKDINIQITKIPYEKKDKVYNTKVKIPLEAKNIKISSEAEYISYFSGKKLNIIDIEKGTTESFPVTEKSTILDYEWVENRSRLLILEGEKEKNSSRVKISYYDAKKHLKEEIAHLAWANIEDTTGHIVISPVIEMIYINITEKDKSRVYSVDLMKNVKEINLGKTSVGNMLVTKENVLLYENLEDSSLMQYNKGEIKEISKLKGTRLWALDKKENIYLYEMKNSKVSDILYIDNISRLNNIKNRNFKRISLDKEYNLNSIYLKDNGEVYVKDQETDIIKGCNSHKVFKYEGDFIGFYKYGFLYKDIKGHIKILEIK